MPEGAERRRETRVDVDRRGNIPTDQESRVGRRRDAEMQEKTPGAQRCRKTQTDAERDEKTHEDAERRGKTPTTALPVSLSRRFLKIGLFWTFLRLFEPCLVTFSLPFFVSFFWRFFSSFRGTFWPHVGFNFRCFSHQKNNSIFDRFFITFWMDFGVLNP